MITVDLRVAVEQLRSRVAAGEAETDLLAPTTNWNLSQTLQHCAQTVTYSVTGYPRLKPAVIRALVGPLVKKVFLVRGATRHSLDAELDGAPPLDPDLPVADALVALLDAVRRFTDHTGPPAPHPVYGRCSRPEYAALHAMHLVEHVPGAVARPTRPT